MRELGRAHRGGGPVEGGGRRDGYRHRHEELICQRPSAVVEPI